jgi:periplasmic protein TonB
MRNAMIIGSLAIHVLVFGYALRVAERPRRRATSVAVVGEKKKEKAPEKPKAKPKAIVAPKPVAQAAPVPLKNAPAPVPETAPAPVDTHLTMDSSDAPGIDVGPKPGDEPAAKTNAPSQKVDRNVKREKIAVPKGDNPENDTCTEAPSKPAPLQRPSEIEYTTAARENGIEGRLVLTIVVGPDGSVLDVKVDKSVDPSLDAAAVAAVKTWTFKPAMRCGKPMGGGVFRIAKTFELGD